MALEWNGMDGRNPIHSSKSKSTDRHHQQTHEAVLLELNSLTATPIRFSAALSATAAAPAVSAAAATGPDADDAMDEDN